MREYKLIFDDHGTGHIKPIPSTKELKDFYANKYFQEERGIYSKKYSQEELNSTCLFDILVYEVYLNEIGRKPSNIADIGCGEGFTSSYFFKKGVDVLAVDFSEFGFKLHNRKVFDLINFQKKDIINDESIYQDSYDLIVIKNVLEHVIDPEKLINNIKSIMHDKSLLCIQVPNDTNNPIMKKYQVRNGINFNKTKNFCPPAHLHYFSHTSLTSFMKTSNLRKIVQIGDFPIEMFLLDDSTDYYKNQNFGKYAHKIRCGFNNVIKDLEIQKVLNLGKCLSDLSLGRNIIGFYKKISN